MVSIIYIIYIQRIIIRGHPSATLLGCLVCIICTSKYFHSFIIKLCIMIVYTLKMSTFYFVHIAWIFLKNSHLWAVLNRDIFPSKMLRWCPVCVICSSNIFHFFTFKLCMMIVHTLIMCSVNFDHTFDKYFLILRGVELRTFFPSKIIWGCLVCVNCNSSNFHSFIFKLCIMIIHTLKMFTSIFVHIW